jgi:DNA-binding beta-propeller fold protein YncE
MTKKLLLLLSLLVIIVLASCSRKVTQVAETIIYPAPPDTARIQFLAKISNSQDVTGERGGFSSFILGEEESLPINKPYGVAVHNGKIYICDTFIHGLVIIDMNKSSFFQFIPEGKGELKLPVNCFIADNGNIYVADSERKQIVIFDSEGNYLSSFGDPDNFKPVDVFIKHDKIWVTNLAAHQIFVYRNDPDHELLAMWPEVDKSMAGCLFSPTNIWVGDSLVYVTDFGDFKVKKYSLEGEYVESIGSYGQALGQFIRPKGLAVDKESNLFVVDAGFENTQIFNKEGKLLMFFGGNYKGPGDMWLPAKVTIDYNNLEYFRKFVDPEYRLKYVILVTNQFGPDKLNIYGAIEPSGKSKSGQKSQSQKAKKNKGPLFN